MKKEKAKDVIAGIFSIFFIGIVFYLYFIQFFQGGVILGFSNFDDIKTYIPNPHNSCHINIIDRTIVLRMDDVRSYSIPSPTLINEVINRELSITLGVIPNGIEKDRKILKYLLKIKDNPLIEIAQHGTRHDEFDVNITEKVLLEGGAKIRKFLRVEPVTYIAPYNEITKEARDIISKYFRIISAGYGVIKEGDNIAELGYTVESYDYEKLQITSNEDIINECKSSLDKTNLCVVGLHPQEYSTDINNPDDISKERFNDFTEMLDELQKLNVKFSTFNDLVVCTD